MTLQQQQRKTQKTLIIANWLYIQHLTLNPIQHTAA